MCAGLCVGPFMAQGKVFMDAQNYKKLYPKVLSFCEILRMRKKIF